jgi:hypothetical protein
MISNNNNNMDQYSEFNSELFHSDINNQNSDINNQNSDIQFEALTDIPQINLSNVFSAITSSMNINKIDSKDDYNAPINIADYNNQMMNGGYQSSDTSNTVSDTVNNHYDTLINNENNSLSDLFDNQSSDEFSLNELLGGNKSDSDTDDLINLSSILNGIDDSSAN